MVLWRKVTKKIVTLHAERKKISKFMKKLLILALMAVICQCGFAANKTFPLKGAFISPDNPRIRYMGRISFTNPKRPTWNYPGVQIITAFEGTSLRMMAKPKSGYFMAQIDEAEPFKVAFRGERDSVVTLATALPDTHHTVRLMYIIEGYEFFPEFWGFVLDEGRTLPDIPEVPTREIEFIGNSITCGYGNEGTDKFQGFEYETENHYYSYASITARNLEAQHWVVARSGIGAYRNYNGPKTGNPESNMLAQYEYTGYAWNPDLRRQPTFLNQKWDFNRYQPDLICINLGTNDLSTPNYDASLLKQNYQKLLKMVRQHNPKAKIVFLTGSMLYNEELKLQKQLLDEVAAEAKKAGDKEVYRFDMSPIAGDPWYGNDWHPNIPQDEKMADELTPFLRKLMNWY